MMVGYMYVYANTGISAEGEEEEKEAKKNKEESMRYLLSNFIAKLFQASHGEGV